MTTTAFEVLSRLVPEAVHACGSEVEVAAYVADGVFRAHGLEEAPNEPTAVPAASSSAASCGSRDFLGDALAPRAYIWRPADPLRAAAAAAAAEEEEEEDSERRPRMAPDVSLHCAAMFEGRQLILHARHGGRGDIHRLTLDVRRFLLDPATVAAQLAGAQGEVVYRLARWDCRLAPLVARIETHLLFRAIPALRPGALVAELSDLAPPLIQRVFASLDRDGLAAAAAASRALLSASRFAYRRRPAAADDQAAKDDPKSTASSSSSRRYRRYPNEWMDDYGWEDGGYGGGYGGGGFVGEGGRHWPPGMPPGAPPLWTNPPPPFPFGGDPFGAGGRHGGRWPPMHLPPPPHYFYDHDGALDGGGGAPYYRRYS